jgi:two-component system response regulator AtoC
VVVSPRLASDFQDAPTITRHQQTQAPVRLCLVVVGESTFCTQPLPESGHVTIGRAETNDVRIDDPSVSREHAILHVEDGLWIEDLGSANGTHVDKARIGSKRRIEVQADHVIEIGSSMVIVQRTSSVRPRRLWTHDYFEARIEDECERARRSRAHFSVLRLHVDGAKPRRVQSTLAAELSSADVIAAYGPDEYEALLVDANHERATEAAQRIVMALDEVDARFGLATYPLDGSTPEALIAHACEAVRAPSSPAPSSGPPLVMKDDAMCELYRVVDRVAAGTISVMLLGETGVGKEVVAEAVHRRSPRRNAPFVRLNCAALSESLLESELFGHEKGAFTGADATKPGLLETASGGTVFLDEVGELPVALQAKLLRVIDERKVLRVGGLQPRPIDVRILSATNRDLEQEVLRRAFRADLFFRLNGISLIIPPLRQRPAEIVPLVEAYVAHLSSAIGVAAPEVSDDAIAMLERYSWPGNIRELKNFIERAILLCTDGTIRPEHLPVEKMRATLLATAPEDLPRPPAPDADLFLADGPEADLTDAERRERRAIVEALEACGGNQTAAAKKIGVSRRTLVSRLDKYAIPRPRKSVS